MTQLGHFVREALCLCAEVRITRNDGTALSVRAHRPESNEYPSLWYNPVVWVEELNTASPPACTQDAKPPKTDSARTDRPNVTVSPDTTGLPPTRETSVWPLRSLDMSTTEETGARVGRKRLMDGLLLLVKAIRAERTSFPDLAESEDSSTRELHLLLVAAGLVSNDGSELARSAYELPALFAKDDVDGLSSILARIAPLARVITALQDSAPCIDYPEELAGSRGRKLGAYLGLARMLGQAVAVQSKEGKQLWYGGGSPSREVFESWLVRTIDVESHRDPLGEVPVKHIAEHALKELNISPARLERALKVVLEGAVGNQLRKHTGGSEERDFLGEEVVTLEPSNYRIVVVGGDGLCGLRSLSRRRS